MLTLTKQCNACHDDLSLDEFHKLTRSPDGRQPRCKACAKARANMMYATNAQYREYRRAKSAEYRERKHDAVLQAQADYRERNRLALREGHRVGRLRRKYGLTDAMIAEMKVAQDFKCGICDEQCELVIDHDHVTGKVRGLLCNSCNQTLGRFGDSVEGLMKAVAYLQGQRF